MLQVYVVLGKRLLPDKYLEVKGNDPKATALHPDAKIRVETLAAICREAPVDMIIFCGGATAGYGLPSEAHSLWAEFLKEDCGPHRPAILLEDESLNTLENAVNVKRLVERVQYFVLHIITSGYHVQRAREIFLGQGLNVEVLAAEDILGNLVPARREELSDYKKSMHFRLESLREWVSRKLSSALLTKLAHIFRQ